MTSEPKTIRISKTQLDSRVKSGSAIKKGFPKQGVLLEARRLKMKSRKGAVLLNDISLSVHPGELTILAGPESSGKSALIQALAGILRMNDGQVLINDIKLSDNYKSLRSRIGYVPREDIAHKDLSVFEALDYASRLRMPRGTTYEARRSRVEAVLRELNLGELRNLRIRTLNTGIRKLVNVGIELITDPGILLLDEPFIDLDAPAASYLFRLLRWMSNRGLPVVLTTRSAEFLGAADKVAFLTRDKSLSWFGPPHEALEYFAAHRKQPEPNRPLTGFDEVFDLLDDPRLGSPADWAARYMASPANKKYAGTGSKEARPELALDERPLAKRRAMLNQGQAITTPRSASAVSQWITLSLRNLKLLERDRVALFLMLIAPLLLPWIDLIISNRGMYDLTLGDPDRITISLALLVLFAMALGGLPWIREFQKEAAIYRRERQVALSINSYVMSKIWLIGLLALYQALVWMVVHFIASAVPLGIPIILNFFIFLALAIFAGGLSGLFASVLISSEKKALLLLSIFLVAQFIFSGAFLPFPKLNPVIATLASVLPARLTFTALSTADGYGSVLATDPCWQLPQDQRQGLTDQQKQTFCSCMGINIFSRCNFPGVLRFYTRAIDQPEPAMPVPDKASSFPVQPIPAPGETLDQYVQDVNKYTIEIESSQTDSSLFLGKLNQYMDVLTTWETERNLAIGKAESQLEDVYNNYAPIYNAKLASILLGMIGEIVLFVILIGGTLKRKDVG